MPTPLPPNGIRCRILHVTDNEPDHRLLQEVVRDQPELALTHVQTGEAALDLLSSNLTRDTQPNVVFVSWFLPGMSGEELIANLKTQESTKALPVVVFTSISDAEEITRIYSLGASCVLGKPLDLDDFASSMRVFAAFWGRIARLPYCR
jgi:two-component system, chemotaxis family, response regulator Rcp1